MIFALLFPGFAVPDSRVIQHPFQHFVMGHQVPMPFLIETDVDVFADVFS